MPETTPKIVIEMFGGLRVRQDGREPVEFPSQQFGALLAALALHLHRSLTREELVELMWPEEEPERGRHKLRDCLHALRRQLDHHSFVPPDLLIATRTTVRLNPAHVCSDVAEFESALQAAGRDIRECAAHPDPGL